MICDEITSALDVSVQGSIVELLEGLRQSRGISMLFVTHNLALVRSIAARVRDPPGRPRRRGRAGGRGDGHTRRRSTPATCSPTVPGSTRAAMPTRRLGPGSRDSCSSTPRTTRRGRTTSVRAGRAEELPTAPRPLEVRSRRRDALGPRRVARRDAHDLAARCSTAARSSTSGTPTAWGRRRCSSARRCRSRRWPTWSAAPCATGALDLDDEVCAHVPELEGPATSARACVDVLTMTSGVDWVEDHRDPDSLASRLVALLRRRRRLARAARRGPRRASLPAPATPTAPPTRRCSTGCASARPGRAFADDLTLLCGSTSAAPPTPPSASRRLRGGAGRRRPGGHGPRLGAAWRCSPSTGPDAGRVVCSTRRGPRRPRVRRTPSSSRGGCPSTITTHAGFGYHWWPLDDARRPGDRRREPRPVRRRRPADRRGRRQDLAVALRRRLGRPAATAT